MRMPLQKILQRDQRAVAVPKSHMLDVRHERKLAAGNQFAEFARRADRRAAAAIDVIVGAAKYQRRHFDFRRVAEGIPSAPRLVMISMLLGARLPFPQRIGKRLDHFRMVFVEVRHRTPCEYSRYDRE